MSYRTMGYKPNEPAFVADVMIGKLAKWLRVLGYDTLYQPSTHNPDAMEGFIREGRIVLTRHRKRAERFGDSAVLIHGHQVKEQLWELIRALSLDLPRSAWFSRCLGCNTLLKRAHKDAARENIPEYVFYQNMPGIRFCPSCGRYFWPGSHREAMEHRLKEWGLPLIR